jgi:hypothetical protein
MMEDLQKLCEKCQKVGFETCRLMAIKAIGDYMAGEKRTTSRDLLAHRTMATVESLNFVAVKT